MEDIERPILPSDRLFPRLKMDGNISFGYQMTSEDVNKFLAKFADKAGMLVYRDGKFTSHCFRRGGAQHRFIHAAKTWNLQAVKWWVVGRVVNRQRQ